MLVSARRGMLEYLETVLVLCGLALLTPTCEGKVYMTVSPYPARVYENAPAAVQVLTVKAYDNITGTPVTSIELEKISDAEYFRIGSDGILETAKVIDKPLKYKFQFFAFAIVPASFEVEYKHVMVEVSSKNTHPPTFSQAVYEFCMYRYASPGAVIGSVNASDLDQDQYNSHFVIYPQSGQTALAYVQVTSSGDVVVKAAPPDRQNPLVLVLLAIDSGSPRLTGNATVLINVEDVKQPDTFCLAMTNSDTTLCWKNPMPGSNFSGFNVQVEGQNLTLRSFVVADPESPEFCFTSDVLATKESYKFQVTVASSLPPSTCHLELSFMKLGPEKIPSTARKTITGFSLDCVEQHFRACNFLKPCKNGATCIPGVGGGLNYTCSCPSGWQGINCTQEDMCSQIPCQNGGNCIFQGHQTYNCSCPEKFFGDVCQYRNICSAATPCQNGGLCHMSDNGTHFCACPNHFTGRDCSHPDPCSPSPCGDGGDCIKVSDTEANCSCYLGRYGPGCREVNICELEQPCSNGRCISTGNSSFKCDCPSSHTGVFCEVFNPCSLAPCQNNATCYLLHNGQYNCTCTPGYYGDECQYYDRCYRKPCNVGTCNTDPGKPLCTCPPDYGGEYCDQYNPCLTEPCGGHGDCVLLPESERQEGDMDYECHCYSSWWGLRCEFVNSCNLNVCKNDARCKNIQPNSFRCTCNPGFYESDCAKYNPCAAHTADQQPCRNGGMCHNTTEGSFTCTCLDGFFGQQCERRNPCLSSPCMNNGTCTNLTDINFTCTCSDEYMGDLCQFRNPCLSQPCQNGGACRFSSEAEERFLCACPDGYLGYYCQIPDPCYKTQDERSLCGNGSCHGVNRTSVASIKDALGDVAFLFRCRCDPGFTGERCEEQASPCVDPACLNNGHCQQGICVCPPLFTGTRCETRLSPCELDPCGPDFLCQSTGTSYTCVCRNGWSPPLCKPVCRKEETYNKRSGRFVWPQADVNETVQVVCPFGGKMGNDSVASRKCLSAGTDSAIWGALNDSDCKELDLVEAGRRLSLLRNLTSSPASLEAADVVNITSALEELYGFTLMDQSIASDMMNVISNLCDVNVSITVISNRNNATSDRLLKLINDFSAEVVTREGRNVTVTSPNFELVALDVSNRSSDIIYIPSVLAGDTTKQLDVRITIPSEALAGGGTRVTSPNVTRLQFIGHKKSQLYIPNDLAYDTLVIQTNPVITATVTGQDIVNLTSPVVYRIRNLKPSANYTCVFWDPENRTWSTEGIVTVAKSGNYTECQSTHLTSFAVLLDPSPEFALSSVHEVALTYISYIGSGLSLVCLVLTTVTYSLFRSLNKDKSGKILLNLCVALLLLNVVFLASGLTAGSASSAACTTVAVILHYLLLASLAWMLVEAVEMYRALVTVFSKYSQCYMLKRCLVGWGVPVLIVAVTLGVSREHYQSNTDFCFLSRSSPAAYYASLVAPACLVLIVNTIIFIMVTRVILKPRFQQQKKDEEGITPAQVRGAFTVMFLLGVTWVFGPLAINEAKVVFNYLFCILNSLQGFLIFVFRCLFNPEARLAWIQLIKTGTLKKRRGPVPSGVYSDTTSKSDSHLKSSGATGTYQSRHGGNGGNGGAGDSYRGSTSTLRTSLIQCNGWHPKLNGHTGGSALQGSGAHSPTGGLYKAEDREGGGSRPDAEDGERVNSELDYGSSDLNKGDGRVTSPAVDSSGAHEAGQATDDSGDKLKAHDDDRCVSTVATTTTSDDSDGRREEMKESHVTNTRSFGGPLLPPSADGGLMHEVSHASSSEQVSDNRTELTSL